MHIQRKWIVWMSIFLSLGLVVLSSGAARIKNETPVVAEEATISTVIDERPSVIGPPLEHKLKRAAVYAAGLEQHKALRTLYIAVQHEQQEKREQEAAQEVSAASVAPPSFLPEKTRGDIWGKLATCETGNTNANTGNGFYGYFQFTLSTWHSVGGTGYPHQHSYATQLQFAQKLASVANPYTQWPVCWPKAVS